MGARRDFLNQALLDQRRNVYQNTIQPGWLKWLKCAVTACGTVSVNEGLPTSFAISQHQAPNALN